jgi:hypothetical protein
MLQERTEIHRDVSACADKDKPREPRVREAEISRHYLEEHQDTRDSHQDEGTDSQWRGPGAQGERFGYFHSSFLLSGSLTVRHGVKTRRSLL